MADVQEHKELKANWANKVDVPTLTQKDVAKHNTKKDCWIIVHGKVYDVSAYLRDHPGGADVLLEVAGTDATAAYEDVGHSDDAGEIMHSFLVGVLEGYVEPSTEAPAPPAATVTVHRGSEASPTSDAASAVALRPALALLAAAGAAGLAYHYHLFPARPATTGHATFAQGFLAATLALSVAGLVGASYVQRQLNVSGKSFTAYPAHMPSQSARPASFTPAGVLAPANYQSFALRSKTELAPGIWRFVFDLPSKYAVLGLPIGQHVAVRASIDGHTVVRSYTPVSNNRDLGRLELLVRVYEQGAMGNYLKNLDVGDRVDMRGPKGAMKYRRSMSRQIGMVGGGTGITPLFQVIRAICEDERDRTRISLVYGNRGEGDILLREKLDAYARAMPDKLQIHYTLDEPADSWDGGRGHVDLDLLRNKMPAPGPDSKVLLCGPPGMVNAVKRSLVELGFESPPSTVSKASDQIFCF